MADDLSGRVFDRRPICGIECAFSQIGGGEEVLETLLVLDADRLAAEFVRQAARGDVRPALPEHLLFGEVS